MSSAVSLDARGPSSRAKQGEIAVLHSGEGETDGGENLCSRCVNEKQVRPEEATFGSGLFVDGRVIWMGDGRLQITGETGERR